MEVLRLMCKYMNSQTVANELFIDKKTVEAHIDKMRQKAGFARYAELLVYVLSNGWINPNF
jgi:DNA-binding CsgD family transcriptional regulator